MPTETLARKLGTTAHLSPLLMKARRLGLRTAGDLCTLAVRRGCRYYAGAGDETMTLREEPAAAEPPCAATLEQFSNEELAIALLSLGLPDSQHRLRVGAAMLAANGNCASEVTRLAVRERCVSVVRHIAKHGRSVEPENPYWQEVLERLPPAPEAEPGTLPHVSRFVAMTGITRHGKKPVMKWIRPTHAPAA